MEKELISIEDINNENNKELIKIKDYKNEFIIKRYRLLPKEILINIFQYFEKKELFELKLINKSFNEAIRDDILWKKEYICYHEHINKIKEKRSSLSELNIKDGIQKDYFSEFVNIKKQLIEHKEKNRLKKLRDESKRKIYLFFLKYTRLFSILMTFIFYISLFLTFCKFFN
jgi:hypothetical protein